MLRDTLIGHRALTSELTSLKIPWVRRSTCGKRSFFPSKAVFKQTDSTGLAEATKNAERCHHIQVTLSDLDNQNTGLCKTLISNMTKLWSKK